MVTHIEKQVNLSSENIVTQLQSEIKYSAELLHPMKSSSTNLARLLSSTLDSTNISFSDIETKVLFKHENILLYYLIIFYIYESIYYIMIMIFL